MAEGATKPTKRLEGAGGADRGLLPEETGSARRLGPKTIEGAEGAIRDSQRTPLRAGSNPGLAGEPRFEPGATWGSQGALLRAESSDELAGSLAPGRERDPIRKALESEAGARAEGARPCAGNEPLEAARKIGEEKEGRGRGGG